MRLAGGTLAALSAALFIAGSSVGAQTPSLPSASPSPGVPPVTFAVEVAYVEVDAIVTDKAGEPVHDLTRDDFVVLEDGKPQTIELFTRIDIPYERPEPAALPAVPPDVRNNLHPFEGRLYVLVLDGLHTSSMRSLLVRAAARRFLQRNFAEGDLAAVVHTSGGATLGQELTDNRQRLLASVDRFMGRRLPSATLSRIDEYRRTQDTRQRGDSVRDPDEMQRAFDARATLDTLDGVADWLSRIRGRRKAVLFFSEGIDYNLYDAINNREASTILDSMRKATATATRGNVSFYTIDPRGLGGLSDEMMEIQPVFDDPALGLDPQGLQSDLRMSQDTLRALADETSGFAAVNTNDFSSAFARVVKDNSAYYVLGYYPAGHPRDGRFHKLQVKVSRPDLKVRARSGYSTPRVRPSRETPTVAGRETPALLAEMLGSPLPRSGLPMAVQAAAFQGSGGRAHVMLGLQLAGGSFKFIEQDGKARETLDVSVAAMDAAGKITAANQKVALDLKPETRKAVEAVGMRVISWMDLAPGRYQIRVAGRGVNSGAAGSVFYDLDVPEFAKEPLALSSLVLTSATASRVPTTGQLELLKDALPGPPTMARVFRAGDTLGLLADIYDAEKTPHTLDIVTTLTASDGSVAYRTADERSSAALKDAGPGAAILHTALVPLKDVAPGAYTLRVTATSRMGKKPPSAERAIRVDVVGASGAP
jgi:VWFA-related protein